MKGDINMKRKLMMTLGAMLVAAILGLAFTQSVSVSAGPELSRQEIEEKVAAQYPGNISALELDESGKKPIYQVELEVDEKVYDLKIDGNSGEVLELDEKSAPVVKKESVPKEKLTIQEKKEVKEEDEEQSEVNQSDTVHKEENTPKNNTEKNEQKTEEKQSAPVQKQNNTEQNVVQNNEPKTAEKKEQQTPATENKTEQTVKTEKPKQQPEKTAPAAEKKTTEKPAEKAPAATEQKPEKRQGKKAVISREKAIQIALQQFSGTVEDVELDDDDGRLIYEVEIENSRGEAEVEIDAYTGKVLLVDIDLDD